MKFKIEKIHLSAYSGITIIKRNKKGKILKNPKVKSSLIVVIDEIVLTPLPYVTTKIDSILTSSVSTPAPMVGDSFRFSELGDLVVTGINIGSVLFTTAKFNMANKDVFDITIGSIVEGLLIGHPVGEGSGYKGIK